MNQVIDQLLLEAQRARLTERRTEARHDLVRPVYISLSRDDACFGFSKNLSRQGVGVILDTDLPVGTIATLSIHYTRSYPAHLKCELRWNDPFGKGWWLTGWKFLSLAPPGMAGRR